VSLVDAPVTNSVVESTVHSLDLVVFICVYFVFFSYCIYVVLLSAQWGGPSGIEAWSLGLLFLQCFDTVGWVFWPIKPVPDMTYNVFGGTLNLAQLNLKYFVFHYCCLDPNVWIVVPVTSPVLVSVGTMFFGSCSILMLVLSVTCACLNMMNIDCMLSRRRERI